MAAAKNYLQMEIDSEYYNQVITKMLECPQGLTFTPGEIKMNARSAILEFKISYNSEECTIKEVKINRTNWELEWMLKYLLKHYSSQNTYSHIESLPIVALLETLHKFSDILGKESSLLLNEYQVMMVSQTSYSLTNFFQLATYMIFNCEIYRKDPTVQEFFSLDLKLPIETPQRFDIKDIATKITNVTSDFFKNVTKLSGYNFKEEKSTADFSFIHEAAAKMLINTPKNFNAFHNAMFEPLHVKNLLSKQNDETIDNAQSELIKCFGSNVIQSSYPLYSLFFINFSRQCAANHLLMTSENSPLNKFTVAESTHRNLKESQLKSVEDIQKFTGDYLDNLITNQTNLVNSLQNSLDLLNEIKI